MGPTLIHTLLDAGVEFVLVGGTAAVLHGAPIVTNDVVIVHRQTPENVDRLVAVLDANHAVVRDDPRRLRVGRELVLPVLAATLDEQLKKR